MSTTTIATTLEPAMADPCQMLLTISKEPSPTIPISIHLSKTGGAAPLGAYVYSIVDKKGRVYQSLLNNASNELVDLAKRLGSLLSRKYGTPSYTSISGALALDEFLPLSREIIGRIEKERQE